MDGWIECRAVLGLGGGEGEEGWRVGVEWVGR